MAGEGRPTLCTPEVQDIMVESVSMGLPIRFACDRAGISAQSHYEWVKRGAEEEQPYSDYADAIKKARADAVLVRLSRIDAAAEAGAWQADMTYLERVYPDEFGRKEIVRSSVAVGQDPNLGPLQVEQSGRLELTGDAALAVLAFHENTEPEVDELHSAPTDAEASGLPEPKQP